MCDRYIDFEHRRRAQISMSGKTVDAKTFLEGEYHSASVGVNIVRRR